MARTTQVYSIDHVAKLIGENLELLEEITSNPDNIDYGEMIHVHNGTEDGVTAFTDRGIECLRDLLADIRTRDDGIREFLADQQCDPDLIERIMPDELKTPLEE